MDNPKKKHTRLVIELVLIGVVIFLAGFAAGFHSLRKDFEENSGDGFWTVDARTGETVFVLRKQILPPRRVPCPERIRVISSGGKRKKPE